MSPPRRPPDDAAEALAAVAPLASRWIERLLAGHHPPLTVAQFLALRSIERESVSGTDLARRTGVSGPAVSQLLTSLGDAGLIERRELPDDRRRLTLSLTGDGQRAVRSAHALLRRQLAALITELPRPEVDVLAVALPKVEAALSGAPPPRRPHPRPPRPGRRPRG